MDKEERRARFEERKHWHDQQNKKRMGRQRDSHARALVAAVAKDVEKYGDEFFDPSEE